MDCVHLKTFQLKWRTVRSEWTTPQLLKPFGLTRGSTWGILAASALKTFAPPPIHRFPNSSSPSACLDLPSFPLPLPASFPPESWNSPVFPSSWASRPPKPTQHCPAARDLFIKQFSANWPRLLQIVVRQSCGRWWGRRQAAPTTPRNMAQCKPRHPLNFPRIHEEWLNIQKKQIVNIYYSFTCQFSTNIQIYPKLKSFHDINSIPTTSLFQNRWIFGAS